MSIDHSPLGQIAQSIVEKRYFRKDKDGKPVEDWRGLVNRVVNHVCASEPQNYKDKIFDLIYTTKFLPNSPCLVNAGTPVGGLLACFVTKSPEDSWVGMMENLANFGHIARRGGGCGVDFSNIRPEGDMVFGSTHARACGPIRHMIVVSEAMNSITQAGFRGMANMGVLRVDHPDIEKFIVCKQRQFALKYLLKEDLFNHYDGLRADDGSLLTHEHANILLDKFISNFNISVLVTDEFMRAVEKDTDFDLTFKGKVYKTIRAKELFQKIVTNAWKNGDPGLLFYNAINNGPYQWSGQELTATNPCVAAGSLVATEFGWKPVEKIKVGDLIWSQNKLYPVETVEINHNYELYRVEFTDGDSIDVTASHKFKCVSNKKYEYRRLDELCIGSKVVVESAPMYNTETKQPSPILGNECDMRILKEKGISTHFWLRDLGLIIGTCIGDGSFTEKINKYNVRVSFSKDESEWQASFVNLLNSYGIENSIEVGESCNVVYSNRLGCLLEICGIKRNTAPNKIIPDNLINSNCKKLLSGILDGLFSTDGNMYLKKDNPMLRFSNSSVELCKQVRRILLGFGIQSRIYKSDRKPHVYNDPKYGEREISSENPKFDIVIMNDGIKRFNDLIGLTHDQKSRKLKQCSDSYHFLGSHWTSTIKSIEKLPGLHTVYDLYNKETDEWNVNGYVQQGCGEQMLPQFGSCNLGSIDVSKFYDAKNDDVDWDALKVAIETSFQFLDNVIDINVFPTPGFEAWAKDNRPVGLGIMGWADLLLKLKIRYGSEDSIEMADKLGKFFHDVSHNKSVQLGKQKGTPKCCQYKELEFRRNATTLSIAPTGSISLIAGCASSIEPIFAPVTYRYDNTGQYTMPHPESNKPYFRCAVDKESKGKREVTWQEHVDMQAVFQKHVDSGISKTINMPNDSTEEDIACAYARSWKNKCKGITIYRDGCKTTQVLNTDRKPFSQNNTQYRPAAVNCDIHRTVANGKDWHIIVGKVDDAPYEIFAVNGRVELPSKGVVVKKKKRHYSLLSEDNEILIDNLNDEEELINDKLGLETRRFSLELRHGIHPKFIVQQIDKSNESLVSFSKAVSRIIKKHYLSDEDCVAIASDVSCPSCASSNIVTEMISESGCWRCPACNYSKCG